jgi:Tol biopolymer transport system component
LGDDIRDYEIFTMRVTGGSGGTPTQLTSNSNRKDDFDPDYSPDGSRIVYTHLEGNDDSDIFTISATGGTRRKLTSNNTMDVDPVYSPDGQQIAYSGTGVVGDGSDFEIFTMPATGGQRVQVTFNNTDDRHPSWQPRLLPALKRLPINVPEPPGLRSPSK